MEVKEEYIKKYWHEIVRDQITDELKEEGFQVFDNYSVDGFTADLYAENGVGAKTGMAYATLNIIGYTKV